MLLLLLLLLLMFLVLILVLVLLLLLLPLHGAVADDAVAGVEVKSTVHSFSYRLTSYLFLVQPSYVVGWKAATT